MKKSRVKLKYRIIPRNLRKSQLFWNFMSIVGKYYPEKEFEKLPNEIIIEPGNPCNLRCPVCPTHFAMKRERGFMKFELFKKIIDEFKDIKKKPLISFSFSGEPLLNKDLPKFVKYANKMGHETFISTNSTILSKSLSKQLIESGLSSIHLCIDGFSRKSQEAYRVGSNFKQVKKNIEEFLEAKKELNKQKPYVSIQTLLTSFSENEQKEIKKWAKRIGANEVNFKSLSMGSYTTKEMKEKYKYLLPKNKKLRRKTTKINKTICATPIEQALVYWNGDLGLCCVDFDNVVKLPNIKEKGFIKTFTSKDLVKKRKLGFRKKFGLCKTCSLGNADSMGFNHKFR